LAVPVEPAGVMAVIVVGLTTLTPVAAAPPIVTLVAPVRFVPLMVTAVPPVAGPEVGDTPVMVGAAMNVNWSAVEVALVPPGVVTVTLTVPAVSAGLKAVMEVALLMMLVAAVVPNSTDVAPVKLVPVMVTLVPPAAGPDVGDTLVTVGAAT